MEGDECTCSQCLDCDARNYRKAKLVDRIGNMLATFSGIPRERIIESSTLAGDLELDSLDRIEVGQMLEDAFGIALSDDEVDQQCMGTVGGIAEYLVTQRGVA